MRKAALITGASSGLGVEFAKLHAQNGDNVVLVARDKDKLLRLKEQLEDLYGIEAIVLVKDLSMSNAAEDIYTELKDYGIEIFYLINNAGFGGKGTFVERSMIEVLAMINVNMVTLTKLTKLFLPQFIARGSGRILNVSSIASLIPGPLQAIYFATKAYVTSLSEAVWYETKNTGVSVTVLLPGATNTNFAKASAMENTKLFKQVASAKEVAKVGFLAMMKGKRSVIAGLGLFQRLAIKSLAFIPKSIILKQVYQLQK